MISLAQCASIAELASSELIVGVVPSDRHNRILSTYLLSKSPSQKTLVDMIVSDLRSFLDIGLQSCAADLLIVLRLLLSKPEEAEAA
jgi:hypothetical protein